MAIPPELLPVVQITLPVLVGMYLAVHSQNKRIDDLITRIAAIENRLLAIENRLASIETTLRNHVERIARLEERIPPLVHKN